MTKRSKEESQISTESVLHESKCNGLNRIEMGRIKIC